MLVQRQTPKRLRTLLITGAAIITPVLGYVVYQNFFSAGAAPEIIGTTAQKTVPADFGQNFFRDARFNALVPKQGTALITQTEVTVPSDTLPAPGAVQAFDMQTGGTVLFTWKKPDGASTATSIRLNRITGQEHINIATLPANATTFQYRSATDGELTTYELHYITQHGIVDSPAVQARTGATGGALTVAAASDEGVKLTWTRPAGDFEAVEVYRSTTVGDLGMRIARLGADETSLDDPQGQPTNFFYVLRWVGASQGGNVWQGQVVSTDRESPASPQAVMATYIDAVADAAADQPYIRLTWSPSPSPDVVAYEIFRSTNAMSLGTKIADKDIKDVASLEAIARDPDLAKDCTRQYCIEDRSFGQGSDLLKGIPYYYTAVAVDRAGNRSSLQDLGVSGRPNPFIPL